MKAFTLCAIMIIGLFCLAFPQRASAQHVHGYSSLTYDDSTGMLHGYSETDPDYSVECYYSSMVDGYLTDETNGGAYLDIQTNIGFYGYASVTTQAQGEAGNDYKLTSLHQQRIENSEPYEEPGGTLRYRWFDYYGFYFLSGDQHYYLYDFFGAGPIAYPENHLVELGETYDRKRTRTPHHLKVLSDEPLSTFCGSKVREVLFQVVDLNGQPTGVTPIKEVYGNTTQNTCNPYQLTPSSCSTLYTTRTGAFIDRLTAGCPAVGSCGFEISPNRWQWCPRGRPAVTLFALNYVVHADKITIGGVEKFPDNSEISPEY